MVAGARRRRRRRRAGRGRSGNYRAADRQAVGVARDADTRPGRDEYCDCGGTRDPPAPTTLSCVAFLSVATPYLRAAEIVNSGQRGAQESFQWLPNPAADLLPLRGCFARLTNPPMAQGDQRLRLLCVLIRLRIVPRNRLARMGSRSSASSTRR